MKKSPGRRRSAAVSAALILVLAGIPLGLYVWGSRASVFAVKAVELDGTDLVAEKRATHLLESAYLGRNLFTIGPSGIERTLAPLLFVKSAGIDRDFPSTLRVRVTEHAPGVYALSDGRWFLVSSDGVVLGAVAREKRKPLPALRAGPGDRSTRLPCVVAAGALRKDARTGDTEVQTALRVAAALPARVAARVKWVRTVDRSVRLRLDEGPVVELGSADRLAQKAYALREVLSWYSAQRASAEYVDVSVPDRPIARPIVAQAAL